jgi:hypothetical protein
VNATQTRGDRSPVPAAIAAVSALLAVTPWFILWRSLPSPIATHWSLNGLPNGTASPLTAFLILALPAVVAAALLAAPTSAQRPGLAFISGLMAVLSASTVIVNHHATTWRAAHLPIALVAVAIAAGAFAALAVRRVVPPGPPSAWMVGWRRRDEASNEQEAFVGHARARGLAIVTVACAGFGVVVLTVHRQPGVLFLLTSMVLFEFSVVTVVAGRQGVVVRAAAGWPRMRIPLDRIDHAETVHINPMQWGGWGYRGVRRATGRAAWVVRGGEGLRLLLKDGTQFAVTVDDAPEAVAVINRLLFHAPE